MPDDAADAGPRDRAPMRRCIVTRASLPVGELIRFVRDPEGYAVADLRQRLPGRGVWVTATRDAVAEAARKGLFSRGFRAGTMARDDLADLVARQLKDAVLGSLGLERKAGRLALGFSEVDAMLRAGRAGLLLHAADAAIDGIRKLDQAAYAGSHAESGVPYRCGAFTSVELSLALGRGNVIHAALERGGACDAVIAKCRRLDRYLNGIGPMGASRDELVGRT